ncbi:MAG: aroB [Micavibrio sp.]|nr:aroB [Micavibrio sp.]
MKKSVDVALGDRSYQVHIGAGLLPKAQGLVPPLQGRLAFILTDENTKVYGETLKAVLEQTASAVHVMHVPPGEETKSFKWFENVVEWMLDHQVTRQSILFAVGGGVVGDLGGFSAASVLRGIDFVQVPTTLLAMVDSSVGGKSGIDTRHGKNLVGAFHQPVSVIADSDALKTLPAREMRAGYAEAVKHGALGDAAFFGWLEENGEKVLALDPSALAQFVETNCSIKATIVAQDEKEAGRRALLNLGHTFGHALENAAGYSGVLLHGEAVAVGCVLAAQLSLRLGFCDAGTLDRLRTHLKSAGLPTTIRDIAGTASYDPAALVKSMYGDKKAETGGLNFVLLNKIGDAFVQRRVAESDVLAVLNQSIQGE